MADVAHFTDAKPGQYLVTLRDEPVEVAPVEVGTNMLIQAGNAPKAKGCGFFGGDDEA